MANTMTGKSSGKAWAGVMVASAFLIMLASVLVATAQQPEPTTRPPRARDVLKNAQEHYKSKDYQAAAGLFAQAQSLQAELTIAEKHDLKTFAQKNSDALAGQRQGEKDIRLAEDAVRAGKTQDAVRLVKGLTANQYLSTADGQKLAKLNDTLQKTGKGNDSVRMPGGQAAGKPWEKGVENNEKKLLEAGRQALQQGELDVAEAFAASAEKVAPFMHLPLADTPSKLRRDIVTARAKLPPSATPTANATEKKEANGIVMQVKRMFTGKADDKKDSPMAPDGSPVRGPDLPHPPAPMKNDQSKRGAQGPAVASGKQPEGPLGPIVTPAPLPPPGSGAANKDLARKLIKEGYKALERNDVETARKKALDAQALRPDLEWWEENPGRLLDDIQRRAPSKVSTPGAKVVPKPGSASAPDAHALIRDARNLFLQEKMDEADKLCTQAATMQPRGWGLFEDSPDKLRADIQKARTKRDRDEAARLLVDARKLYAMGNLQEAKQKAYSAQQLHGPYTIWDLGDRPQKLLEEIQRVEAKLPAPGNHPPANAVLANAVVGNTAPGNAGPSSAAPRNAAPAAEPVKTADLRKPTIPAALVSGTAQAGAKIRAANLLQQACELQKQGLLVEAREKAIEADKLKVAYAPEEDSPASVLVSLAAQCERTVDQLLQRATDQVQDHPTDPKRFKKAEADINKARLFARTFRLDDMRIEQKAQWLQQASAPAAQQPITLVKAANEPPAIVQAGGPPPLPLPPPPVESPAAQNRLLGLEKLDKARLELRAGNLTMARRLAEDAFHPQYGIQEEAAMVLRSIDADDHNHHVNIANRNADAGIDAYNRRDFRQAATIFQGIDMRLLPADKARRIGELMLNPAIQPQSLQLVDAQRAGQPGSAVPGIATATDFQAGDDLTKSFRAMEEIQFQQMRDRAMTVQKSAMELFKAGRKAQAVEVLKDYVDELGGAQLDAQRLALLKGPVEKRIQQYRTILAQDAMEKQVDSVTTKWNEGTRDKAIRKTQEEVAEQIKAYRTFHKEGKYKEALAAAKKAKELDPDNLTADAAIQLVSVKIAIEDADKGRTQNEEMFLKGLNPGNGPYVDMTAPLAYDPEALKRAQQRKNGENGFALPTRDATERNIERKLSEPVSLTFKDAPLQQVIADLNTLVPGANIIADRRALSEANISLDMPLNLAVDRISLKSALNILLDQVKLTYVIENQSLMITTKEKASGRNRPVTYSVADLVVPVENHPTPAVSDINSALSRHLVGATGMVNSGVSPYTTSYSLQNGTPVSSQGSGAGSGFATTAPGGSVPSLVQPRPAGTTIEDLLIGLIKSTISPNSWSDVGGQGTIQYFPLGMALVVNQTQEVQEEVAALLQSLRRLQDLEVAIEMRLVSVSESFFERIGVDFDVNFKSPTSATNQVNLVNGQFTPFGQVNSTFQGLKAVTGLTPAGTLTPDLGIPVKNSSFDFSIPPFGGYPGTLGADGGLSLGLAFLSDIQVFMFLEAAQGDRRMNVMQAPKLTVFNGQTATISINDFQFFLTGLNINVAGGQLIYTPNNQPFPLGVTMTVTPVVSADRRFVRLNLTPNLTNLANANVPLIPVQIPVPQLLEGPGAGTTILGQPVIFQMFFQQPTFTSISVNTTVNVPDGGTVLLGGLKTMSEGRNEFGPPILSKIPYLSRLFKNVSYGRDGQSLMIMVTPRIIINEEEEQQFTGVIPQIPRP